MNRKSAHAIVTCLLTAASLWASIQSAMEPPPYYQNVPFLFKVQCKDDSNPKPPEMMPTEDFIVRQGPPQRSSVNQIYFINGKTTRNASITTIYPFYLTPKKSGTLTLPQCIVYQDGRKKKLPRQTITVQAPNRNDLITLTMTADKTVCALGQPVRLSFVWKIRLPSQNFDSQSPIRGLDIAIPALSLPNLDAEPIPLHGEKQVLPINRGQNTVEARPQVYGTILSLAFDYNVIPRKAGILKLPPATILCEVMDGVRRKRSGQIHPFFFDSPYEATFVRAAAESKPLTLKVKEPPTANRPDSYAGLAEPCTVSTTADKTDVYVGDPIQLTVTVKGPKFPKSIILPKLQQNHNFAKAFRVFDNDEPGTVQQDGSVTFLRTIRASTTQVTQIPPVSLSWFDPKTETYRTAHSKPIPLTVKPTQIATSITRQDSPEPEEKIEVTTADEGPRPSAPPQECLENQRDKTANPLLTAEALVLFSLPCLTLLVLAVKAGVRRSRKNIPAHLRKTAASRAIRALQAAVGKTAPEHDMVRALQEYVANKTQRPKESLTLQDLELYLDQVKAPRELKSQMQTIIGQCEAAIYASTPLANPTETSETLQQLILQADRL